MAAVTGAGFVLWKAGLIFWLLIIGGVGVGIVMSKVLGAILRSTRHSHLAVLSFLLLAPFVTYLVAEMAHVSGVIAVVTLGLGISRLSNRTFPDFIKTQSKTLWDIVSFLLNGLIFILLGLELPLVLKTIDKHLILPYIGYAFLITIVALLIRMIRIFLQRRNLQRGYNAKKRKIAEEALLSIRECLIISWSGMRGIVSLAMAIGLPKFADSGIPFPMRNTIIFIATIVVLITIIGQGLVLPVIVKKNAGA
ncbi:cation:proton antiporter [Agriterribacter sp.]|uniref:cation:proton antiporter domain-containing protein n=1 Tax=Agriterribacter sp. TaxID=2821509 RepID=UPI002BD0C1D3|nr:cation:proton antiporter [Agriterribacter sp.]HRP58120.1 cation:proton antiporter [Agriterribacter sp.]